MSLTLARSGSAVVRPSPRTYHTCPCCGRPANLYICTGIRKETNCPVSVAALFTTEEAAKKLAEVLGLTPTGFVRYKGPCGEATDKLRDLWTALIPCEYEDPVDPIICAFCARFLPSLVSAYKDAPCEEGPYYCMLVAVLQSNYFAKYMRSPHGPDLYAFFVQQIISRKHPSTSISGLLIFATYAHEYKSHIRPLPEDTVAQLKDWLRTKADESLEIIRSKPSRPKKDHSWAVRYHETILENIISVLNILDGRLRSEAKQLTLTRSVTFDGFAGEHEDSENLTRRECARCQTVAYCCRVHQKEDWGHHKQRCFETAY
ncbi:hypothetical protein MSAN_01206500 [Mycena sanguinolenta]|uniref:MYND-type domain-containing protein n=1 Tax=Mycena sanguinolenta TaxID=230812 RepID=A0A8H7D237_9AGAR|nr:hypothetical protein MSAN_01206500 [Mycena sanguinolenta]